MPTRRRWRRSLLALTGVAGLITMITGLDTVSPRRAGAANVDLGNRNVSPRPVSTAARTFNVLRYGANGNGSADNTEAFAKAIAAAEAQGGGTVFVPKGTYAFTARMPETNEASIRLNGDVPVSLIGAGRHKVRLVEHVPHQDLLSITDNGSALEHVMLNAKSYTGGKALTVRANNTLVDYVKIEGARITARIGSKQIPNGSPFAVYYSGPLHAKIRAPIYNVGNRFEHAVVSDGVNNDGFSFAFQKDGIIRDVRHWGSRLALYADSHVTVDTYHYSPNPGCLGATNGFWITPPSNHITIANFTTTGEGGIIGDQERGVSSDIVIKDEKFKSPVGDNALEVGNVNGLQISGSNFGRGNFLRVNPPDTARGIVVSYSIIPGVEFATLKSRYTQADLTFDHDWFPPFRFGGDDHHTFRQENTVGPTTVTIRGGTWSNSSGGFSQTTPKVVFHVTNLAGRS